MNHITNKKNEVEILYVLDALCGWCYGLSPTIDKIINYCEASEATLKPVHGGLWPGDRARKMDESLVHHLKNGMPKVTEYTGQPFGEAFHNNIVDNSEFIYDTEPTARAAIVVRKLSADHELNFIKDVQVAFFVNGLDPTRVETFLSIVRRYGISESDFVNEYNSHEIITKTQNEFLQCIKWGVTAYPALLCKFNEKISAISIGTCDFEQVVDTVNKITNTESI